MEECFEWAIGAVYILILALLVLLVLSFFPNGIEEDRNECINSGGTFIENDNGWQCNFNDKEN